ncbi:phage major capsid protein, HK97 family [Acidovorax sp. CF316]|uniref:phage major capsid protein n=1 Tax=Acidovorax sp. CF316 TaxID=1144317 RepID=UPI00026BC7F1|nr:phage major capsid protein [Acidovorax sp. CF316]EJE49582.1 phage major capsid protein, HK97 family [Acidovorax sp. CF316]
MKKSRIAIAAVAALACMAVVSAQASALQVVADHAAAKPVPRGLIAVRADTPPGPGEVKAAVEALNKAFADFKAEHTKQLEDVKKGNADALQALKVDRINSDIGTLQKSVDDLNVKLAAGQMNGGAGGGRIADAEYTESFRAHFTRGDVNAALNKGVATEGGYLAPVEWDRTITDRLVQVSPMRGICSVQKIGTAGYTKLFNNRGTTSGWVGETTARTQTNTPSFSPLTYKPGEIYANPAATQQMLDDSEVDLEAWLAGEVEMEFAYQEGLAFLAGTGANDRPNGILTYVTGGANAAAHPWGDIKTVGSGAVGAVTADAVLDLIYALPGEYTADARFVMNRSSQGSVRKLKDGQGNYLWQPSYVAGQPATLGGYPVTDMAGMPNIAASAKPILFGDFKRGYQIVDRAGVRVLRDPYTNKPYVHFYTTKRVGGGLLNPDVLKALNVNAS